MSLVDAALARRQEEQIRDIHEAPSLRGRPGFKGETPCRGCGRRTRHASGRCTTCQRTMEGLDLRRLATEHLVAMMARVREELTRRRDEASAALSEVTP